MRALHGGVHLRRLPPGGPLSLSRPPLKQLEAGILGDGNTPARGLPAPMADAKRLRLDFMPVIKRTVQAYG